jgi:hypothetical protein
MVILTIKGSCVDPAGYVQRISGIIAAGAHAAGGMLEMVPITKVYLSINLHSRIERN